MKASAVAKIGAIGSIALAILSLSSPAQSGPANSDAKLRFATASSNNKNPQSKKQFGPDEVVLKNVKRGWTSVTWEAETPAGYFSCQADDMLHNFDCFPSKPKSANSEKPSGG